MKQLILVMILFAGFWGRANTFFTPELFGAIGDGVNDDTAAFQSAINFGQLWGWPVKLGAKTYRLEGSLVVDSYTTLIGMGSRHTVLSFGDLPLAIKTPSHGQPNAMGNHEQIRLEGFTVACSLRMNERYEGVSLWGVDRPVVRDITIQNVSVGHAFLFAYCREASLGDIRQIRAENCNFTTPQTGTTSVIHISACEDLFIQELSVINATGVGPGDQRDAVSCVLSKNITISGIRGIGIDSLLDAGRNEHCLFEDFFASNAKQIPIYSNNGNRYCTFRNGRFENTDFGILIVAPTAATGFPVDSYNLFENFEFYQPSAFGDMRAGIEVWAATDDPNRAPHDNIFRNIHFVDPADPPNMSQVIFENTSTPGLNTYHQCTVDLPNSSQTLASRVTGPTNDGANIQGLEEKVGQYVVDLGAIANSQWQSPVITIGGVQSIVGVTIGVNSASTSDSVQYLHAVVRAMSGNQFRIVIRTLDGSPINTKVTGEVRFIYRVLAE